MLEFASIVDVDQLLQAIVASIVAAIAVTIVVCLSIWGAVKYADYGQDGRTVAATGALAVSFFGLGATFGIVALALYLMITG